MKKRTETNLSKKEVLKILENEICHHSPILNSAHIKKVDTDKELCGEIKENSLFVWKTLNKKTVVVPILKCEIEDGFIAIKVTLPIQNEYMMLFWFCITFLYAVVNSIYLPFSQSKLLYLVNVLVGVVIFLVSFVSFSRLFFKRTKETINTLKKLIEG